MCETVVLLTYDLRTDESIGKQRKPTQKVVLIFGRANIAPRYTINKIKKISLGRFFKIFLIVYSRIRSLGTCLCASCAETVTISLRVTCEIYLFSNRWFSSHYPKTKNKNTLAGV